MPSWHHRGPSSVHLEGDLGSSDASLGSPWASLGTSWVHLATEIATKNREHWNGLWIDLYSFKESQNRTGFDLFYLWLDGMATRIVPGASRTRCARSTRYGRSARNIVCASWDRNPKYYEKHWEKLLWGIVHGSNESQKPSKLGLLVLGWTTWRILARSWCHLGTALGSSCASFGSSWSYLGLSRAQLGTEIPKSWKTLKSIGFHWFSYT